MGSQSARTAAAGWREREKAQQPQQQQQSLAATSPRDALKPTTVVVKGTGVGLGGGGVGGVGGGAGGVGKVVAPASTKVGGSGGGKSAGVTPGLDRQLKQQQAAKYVQFDNICYNTQKNHHPHRFATHIHRFANLFDSKSNSKSPVLSGLMWGWRNRSVCG